MAEYVKESVDWMDKNNPVLPDNDPYTIRLKKLTDGITDTDGIPLNFKVYDVIDVNAFACPDGSPNRALDEALRKRWHSSP